MSTYPTRITVRRGSKGFRVGARFRGATGKAYGRILFTAIDAGQLHSDLEAWLDAASASNELTPGGRV